MSKDNSSAAGAAPRPQGHTPGPWIIASYGEIGDGTDTLVIHSSPDDRVCFLATPNRHYERLAIVANARLISAAPEMLEALKEGVATFWGDDGAKIMAWRRRALAAISKAEGQP